MSVRLGIERPGRPTEVVATAEARVIHHELSRRLGDVTVDLRVAGDALGPWQPLAHAAWPADIDHRLDESVLWADDLPPMTSLLPRTVDPAAAAVRERMLRHLGVIPDGEFVLDDDFLSGLGIRTLRPTDLWLIARAASSIDADAARGFMSGADDDARLDTLFDAVVADIDIDLTPTIQRLVAERDVARRDAQEAVDEALRVRAETADHLDALNADIDALRDRLDRAELSSTLDA